MKRYSQSWIFNEHLVSKLINKFKVSKKDEKVQIYLDDDLITETDDKNKTIFFQTKQFKELFLNQIKNFNIKPLLIVFEMKDGLYEFKIVCDTVLINNETYFKYISLVDSLNGKISLQLNYGLIHQKTNSIIIIDYNNKYVSHTFKHGKYSFDEKINGLQDALKAYDNAIEKTANTLERLKRDKISYRKVYEKLVEYDEKGEIKLGNRQKLIALNKKIRDNYNLKDEATIEALKNPIVFLKSNLDFNISTNTLFHLYADIYKAQDSGAIIRECNRILQIFSIIFEENNINNNPEKIFEKKTGMTFKSFYSNHFVKLTWFLVNYTKDIEKAQDFANEAFIQGLDKIESYDKEKSKIHTWIYKIAENLVRKNFKDEQKIPVVSIDNNVDCSLLNIITDKTDIVDKEEKYLMLEKKADLLRETIYNLPEKYSKYKKVLIMREIDNMRYEDISDKLGINLSTIKSQILKGRQIVTKKVERDFKNIEKEFLAK